MSDVMGLADWAMSDLEGLALWGGLAGVVAGITVGLLTRGQRRAAIVRWCFLFGVTALATLGIVMATGGAPRPVSKAWALALVGYPALVAGVALLALSRLQRKAQRREGRRA